MFKSKKNNNRPGAEISWDEFFEDKISWVDIFGDSLSLNNWPIIGSLVESFKSVANTSFVQ